MGGWYQNGPSRSGMKKHGMDWSGSEYGQVAGSFYYGNDRSGYIKSGGISWQAEGLLASQEGLCCMDVVVCDKIQATNFRSLKSMEVLLKINCSYPTVEIIKINQWMLSEGNDVSSLCEPVMQDVHVTLNPVLWWQKPHWTRQPFSSANWT